MLTWIQDNPLGFAAIAALAGLPRWCRCADVGWPDTRGARLNGATREPVRATRPLSADVVMGLTALVAVASLVAVTSAIARDDLWSEPGVVGLAALTLTALAAVLLYGRLYNGVGAPEPMRSRLVLAGRLYLVRSFPTLPELGRLPSVRRSSSAGLPSASAFPCCTASTR